MFYHTLTEMPRYWSDGLSSLNFPILPQESKDQDKENLDGLVVLLVDDAPDVLHIVSRILKKYGAQVVTADSAASAYQRMQETKPDVIVSDIAMPGESGYELMKRIRTMKFQDGGGTPAIALTAFSGDSDRKLSLNCGYQAHLTKPVEPPVLLHTIRSLVVPENGMLN